jgi:hypothetical protein
VRSEGTPSARTGDSIRSQTATSESRHRRPQADRDVCRAMSQFRELSLRTPLQYDCSSPP